MNTDKKPEPIIDTPSIRDIHRISAALYFKYLSPKDRGDEDLNDKKVAWLIAASQIPEELLTIKELRFKREYNDQGIRFSLYWHLKPEIVQFYNEQKQKMFSRLPPNQNLSS